MLGADDTLRFAGWESKLCGDTVGENLAAKSPSEFEIKLPPPKLTLPLALPVATILKVRLKSLPLPSTPFGGFINRALPTIKLPSVLFFKAALNAVAVPSAFKKAAS